MSRSLAEDVRRERPGGSVWFEGALALLLCSAFAALAISHAWTICATFDETVHIPAGLSYWRWHDYRLNPAHPPLVKKLAAIPLLWRPIWPPAVELTREE